MALLRIQKRYSDRWRTTDNNKMGLVQNIISIQYIIRFTSRFVSLTVINLEYLKTRLEVEYGHVNYF